MRTLRPTRGGTRYVARPPLRRVLAAWAAPHAARIRAAVFRRGTLSIVGLGALVGAAWQYGIVPGLVALGVALLIVDGRIIE